MTTVPIKCGACNHWRLAEPNEINIVFISPLRCPKCGARVMHTVQTISEGGSPKGAASCNGNILPPDLFEEKE